MSSRRKAGKRPAARRGLWFVAGLPLLALTCLFLAGCGGGAAASGKKVLHYPFRARVGNLDPVRTNSQYQNRANSAIFDALLQYRYPVRPFELEPNLLVEMPRVSEDGLTYSFELERGIHFADDPAFASTGGKGPEITTDDVFYSLKRSTDAHWNPTGYWLLQGRIEGLDEYKAAEAARKERFQSEGRGDDFVFDYDRPVSGLRKIDDHRFEIVLTDRFPQFLYVLAMMYTAVVPREAVEHYGLEFGQHPVGSGPFRVKEFWRGSWLKLERNPTFREERIPEDLHPDQIAAGLGEYAGRRLPILDEIVMEIFEQDQPMWLKFRANDLDATQVPAEYWPSTFNDDWELEGWAVEEGVRNYNLPLLDLIYWGFNMEDPVWGQAPESRLVRQAIAYAVSLEDRNDIFYNGTNTIYEGPIPPGLEGYEESRRPHDVERALRLLEEAGHPRGEGLPVLEYETSRGGNSAEQAEFLRRALDNVGIELEVNLNSFPELSDKLNRKKAAFFGLAWGADYPDAENFLQLFYGPNEAPGSNSFNYKNPEYDRLYERTKTMQPGPERTEIYGRMREIVIRDKPMIGSMARTRFYIWRPRLRNFQPEEVYGTWWKYLDIVAEAE